MAGPPSTRERILDAAEELFAELGIADTSLRALTRHAGVNLAAVHYHFGSKDGLLDAVVERIAEPINAERRRALARIEAEATGRPEAADLLRAYFGPVVERLDAPEHPGRRVALARLLARIESEPPGEIARLGWRHFGATAAAYIEVLRRALPDLDPALVIERFRLANAVFTAAFSSEAALEAAADLAPRAVEPEALAREAIEFAIAGLSAPPHPPCPPTRTPSGRSERCGKEHLERLQQ
jgi:AcrR family transcriptional regulator